MMRIIQTLLLSLTTLAPSLVLAAGIQNPLNSNYTTLPAFLNRLLDIVIMFSVPIVVLAVIYAGFLFVTAGENAEKLRNAKKILFYTLLGALIVLGAKVIASVVAGTVDQFTS